MSEKMVSVTIPTMNSGRTLRSALESVRGQTYEDIQVTIVDSQSSDRTVDIARELGADIVPYHGKVLGARIEGFRHRPGTYHLLLDSDQVLERTAVERCLKVVDRYDMLCLEERSFEPTTWLERLFEADRALLHQNAECYMDALHGVLCPRFYRSELLEKAFANIPNDCISKIHAFEDAIIFYECSKISDRIGLIEDGTWHREPRYFSELWNKNYRYGRDVRSMYDLGCYEELIKGKERFRRMDMKNPFGTLKANLLLVLKGVPYELGYLMGRKKGST